MTEGVPLPVMLADTRRSLELVTGAYHSMRIGRPPPLPITEAHPLYASWLPAEAQKAAG